MRLPHGYTNSTERLAPGLVRKWPTSIEPP